jgi:hypothetical protein
LLGNCQLLQDRSWLMSKIGVAAKYLLVRIVHWLLTWFMCYVFPPFAQGFSGGLVRSGTFSEKMCGALGRFWKCMSFDLGHVQSGFWLSQKQLETAC